MAEVLAPVQIQQAPSITMLHSSSDPFQNASSGQPQAQSSRHSSMPRTHTYNSPNSSTGYRGSSTAPISPYAFQSTPQLKQEHRASSAPQVPLHTGSHNGSRSGQSNASSISTNASTVSSTSSRSLAGNYTTSKDDMALPAAGVKAVEVAGRPVSSISLSSSVPDLSLPPILPVTEATPKASPNRYRRTAQRQDSSSASTLQAQQEKTSIGSASSPKDATAASIQGAASFEGGARANHARTTSDDTTRSGSTEQAKRYRRRSLGNFEPGVGISPVTSVSTSSAMLSQPTPGTKTAERPVSVDGKRGGNHNDAFNHKPRPQTDRRESYHSGRSMSSASPRPASPLARADGRPPSPLRTSDSGKRPAKSSPLSKPTTSDLDVPTQSLSKLKDSIEAETDAPAPPSAAVQQLAALSDKDAARGKTSRLRRAFSFGSAAELRKASAQNAHVERERNKLTKERSEAELQEAQDAARAAELEQAGLGNSIYSGQGGVFASSTDNLSISSTASSASLMLRKMGKSMKKGARSVKGLFRPKSVIGVPAADGPITTEPSQAQVSMVTVEAERERVNVDAHPHQKDGGTGFPHLERNSLDASNVTEVAQAPVANQRKSIVGGDSERDEVLRAVRKGILKRTGTGTSSGTASPVIATHSEATTPSEFGLPQVPHILDSPISSQPSTPATEGGISKSSSFPNPGNSRPDYFSTQTSRPFASQSTRSLPSTPNGSRNIAFNPRIQFHDVWSPTEYDRRGDIATCNRLTPMLAQQIKEELNSFKMVGLITVSNVQSN